MTSKQKGDMALGKAIAYFLDHDYEVCLPIGDKRDFDLVVEKQGKLYRIRVRYAGLYANKGKCQAALRIMGGNQSFHYTKKYAANAFEYLYVHTAKGESYLFPWNQLSIRSILSVEAIKYRAFKV